AVLNESMREAAMRGRNVDDALVRLFSTGYAFYKSQLPLARAAFSVSWTPGEGELLRNGQLAVIEIVAEHLAAGVERGELSRECEIKLRSQMLFDAYLANYPRAVFGGWSLEALQGRLKDQVRVILAGARRG